MTSVDRKPRPFLLVRRILITIRSESWNQMKTTIPIILCSRLPTRSLGPRSTGLKGKAEGRPLRVIWPPSAVLCGRRSSAPHTSGSCTISSMSRPVFKSLSNLLAQRKEKEEDTGSLIIYIPLTSFHLLLHLLHVLHHHPLHLLPLPSLPPPRHLCSCLHLTAWLFLKTSLLLFESIRRHCLSMKQASRASLSAHPILLANPLKVCSPLSF